MKKNKEIDCWLWWPAVNVGFISKGVEKIDIAREYGNQSEITATGRDKILPAPAIQIVYQSIEDCCGYLMCCPSGIVLRRCN